MRPAVVGVVAGLLGSAVAASQGESQEKPTIFVAAGPAFPMVDKGDYGDPGWFSYAGVNVPVGSRGLRVGGNLVYGRNKHSYVAGDKANLLGFFGFWQYRLGNPAKPGIYVVNVAGALNHQYKIARPSAFGDQGGWKAAFGGGVGVDIPAGRVGIFIEFLFIARGDTRFLPLAAGMSFPFGKTK